MYILAIINLYTESEEGYELKTISHDLSAADWLLKNIGSGQNFQVYEGQLSNDHEISRDYGKVSKAKEVSVFIAPAGSLIVQAFAATVFVAKAIIPQPGSFGNINRRQESPNNSLTDRRNKARPNQRIVDVCGKVKSIPDVLSREYVRFVDDVEERIGYYIVARKSLLIEDIKESSTLISDIPTSSAGVYGPNTSPNNSAPYIQIGPVINERVYNVLQAPEATGQVLTARNANTLNLEGVFSATSAGVIIDDNEEVDFTENYQAGNQITLSEVYVNNDSDQKTLIGQLTTLVVAVSAHAITFDITGDSSWALIKSGSDLIQQSDTPRIEETTNNVIGPFKITSQKINRLLVNVSALNGLYKDDGKGRSQVTTGYTFKYQKLDDNGGLIGAEISVNGNVTGKSSSSKGFTTDIDLGGPSFVQWSIQRSTLIDFEFEGTVVDDINLNSIFGLADIDKTDFGDVTTIQTKRTNAFLTASTKAAELNCIATELVNRYENGVFSPALTPNTQAMQSLIRIALDSFIGRRVVGEIDLDNLVAIQEENETYFGTSKSGEFSYSFDSTKLSAQESFLAIGSAAFITLWREGRVLKGWFERPQSVPSMVFTHRSKQPNAEGWERKRFSSKSNDSIEFTYTDSLQYTKETLFYPEDKSGKNPKRVELTGIKGRDQAFWHMMRIFNKDKYQEISVDFGATAEGRFVKPNRLISVVKGSRVYTYDGYIVNIDGLLVTLSQDVAFTPNDGHSIILKNRGGSTESVMVFETEFANVVKLLNPPTENIYTGNNELKTEFSFGNEARLDGQLMLPTEIAPSGDSYVKIKAINYSPLYYTSDTVQTNKAFSLGFDDGFS